MKKILIALSLLIAGSLVLSTGCKKEQDAEPGMPTVGNSAPVTEDGLWINDDTFRIAAMGAVKKDDEKKSALIRKEMACTAARLTAMHMIMTTFTGAETAAVTSKDLGKGRFSGTIRNGTVVTKTFDEAENTCRIIFEVSSPGLKKSIKK